MTVPDFIDEVCRQCVASDHSLYFLGGVEGDAERAKETLQERHPKLKVVGVHHGYFTAPEQETKLKEEIQRLAPHLLLVGMGSPQQELSINRNLRGLNVRVGWSVGGLFDILGGRVPHPPAWAVQSGFEWLHRLVVEPERLWRRYLIGNARFLCAVLAARISGAANRH